VGQTFCKDSPEVQEVIVSSKNCTKLGINDDEKQQQQTAQ